ncbi:MAG: cysteine desulfurase [Parvularculales bacterium]
MTALTQAVDSSQPVGKYDVEAIRQDFPILGRTVYDKPLVYLDSAASAQKPRAVLDAVQSFYENDYANVHRGLHYLSNQATEKFEEAREKVRRFINAPSPEEIIFTANSTDAINMVAAGFAEPHIKEGDEIVLSILEHHSNIVPWHFLRERHGATLKWVPCQDDGTLSLDEYEKLLGPRTKLVALTQMSNAFGVITPIKEMIKRAHERNIPVLIDGSQSAVHGVIDVQALGCDFFVFTGHKLYGPSGVGVLYGQRHHLESMRPYRGGGEMIQEVTTDHVSYRGAPHRFEAGTPAIAQVVGLGAAVDYVTSVGRENIMAHEAELLAYATERIRNIKALRILGDTPEKGAIISLVSEAAHPHDIAMVLDRMGVAVRAGHHCAQPLMDRFGVAGTTRASFGLYTSREDLDCLIEALDKSVKFFG